MPNTPLQDLALGQLRDAADQLKALAATTTDRDVYAVANDSEAQIQSRISTLLNLELAGDTAAMQAQAISISETKSAFDSAVKNIAVANDVVTGTAKFLGAMDILIKVATRLA
jgi:hypothetical protein